MSKYVFLQRYSAGQLGGGLSICKSGLNSAEENILLLHNHCFCVHSNLLENVKVLSQMKRDKRKVKKKLKKKITSVSFMYVCVAGNGEMLFSPLFFNNSLSGQSSFRI